MTDLPEPALAGDPSPVLILPGHYFFVDRIELPESLESSEIDDFAELSMEGLSPFPIEQLYWGFLYDPSAGSILLYAAYKERIKKAGFDQFDSYLWVLPDFATLGGASFNQPTTLSLQSDSGSAEIVYAKSGEALPSMVTARGLDHHSSHPEGHSAAFPLKLAFTEVNEQGLPTFSFEAADRGSAEPDGHWKALTPPESALWRADIREPLFKKNERNSRKASRWVSRATAYAALFALLLCLLEGMLFLGQLWQDSRNAIIATQSPEVRRIEDKQSLMNKLDQVAQNELRPIAILEALNQLRPAGIYFTSTITEGQNRIIIDGIATTINELNAYTDALRASGKFVLANEPKTLTRGGRTTFTATLDYTHQANNPDIAEETVEG